MLEKSAGSPTSAGQILALEIPVGPMPAHQMVNQPLAHGHLEAFNGIQQQQPQAAIKTIAAPDQLQRGAPLNCEPGLP